MKIKKLWSLDSIGINWIQSYWCDSIKTCESEKQIDGASSWLRAACLHICPPKTTMIMRRCPSEVSVEASDMGNPECFAHWVLLINFCFSTPGNEFQIKLKVSWNHDENKVWSVVWAWLEKSSQFLRSVDIRQLVVRSCGLSPGLSDTQHATVFVGYDHHNLDRSEVWHLLKLKFV